jgi:hypothetical protein
MGTDRTTATQAAGRTRPGGVRSSGALTGRFLSVRRWADVVPGDGAILWNIQVVTGLHGYLCSGPVTWA